MKFYLVKSSPIVNYFLFCIIVFVFSSSYASSRPHFLKKIIQIGKKSISVEVAKTPEETAYGLMYIRALGENEGMLFIFSKEQKLSFWMKNTFIDLSIAYIDSNKKIIEIIDMKAAQSELQNHFDSYISSKPAQYALEMKKGWFKKNKIKVGDKLIFVSL